MTSDPIGLNGGLNTFGYAAQNPLMYVDPYGLYIVVDIPQSVVNFSAGLGDGLLVGTGSYIRNFANIDGGVNTSKSSYKYGSIASFAAGASRLTYAALAKGGSIFASSGAAASQFRNQIKTTFRLGLAKDWRPATNLAKKTDAQLRKSAGKTNIWINLYGAGVTVGSGTGMVGEDDCYDY